MFANNKVTVTMEDDTGNRMSLDVHGGAISNQGSIENINADFINNSMETSVIGNGLIEAYAVRVVLGWLSVLGRFSNLAAGVFDVGAIVYFASVSFVFIFLTVRVYEKRRWS